METAEAAFTGTARVRGERALSADETDFRGPGFAITAEVAPEEVLFGELPTPEPLVVVGQTMLPPERRVDPRGPRFPPDSPRAVPYWDSAQAGVPESVLVVQTDPPTIRVLLGPDDDLPAGVEIIRRWTELDEGEREGAVRADLESPDARGASAVSYVSGFELLLRSATDRSRLVRWFLRLPGRPAAAARGALRHLYLVAGGFPDDEMKAVAWQLVEALAVEREPEAIVGYLAWFDAHRERTWQSDAAMAAAVMAQVERVAKLTFDGTDGELWKQEVDQAALALRVDGS